jgi:hypothetical protein
VADFEAGAQDQHPALGTRQASDAGIEAQDRPSKRPVVAPESRAPSGTDVCDAGRST